MPSNRIQRQFFNCLYTWECFFVGWQVFACASFETTKAGVCNLFQKAVSHAPPPIDDARPATHICSTTLLPNHNGPPMFSWYIYFPGAQLVCISSDFHVPMYFPAK
jgi:hypothetical protein